MAYVTCTSVLQPQYLAYHCAHGVTPGVVTIRAIPQGTLLQALVTVFWTDDITFVNLPNCRIKSTQIEYGIRGPELVIAIEDRRWAWHGKAIDGHYNIRDAAGTIIPATAKSPRELATLLWNAMGETGANVLNLPTGAGPEVDWECAEAAVELENLCAMYGCRPGLNPYDNTAGVFLLGAGTSLPNNTFVRYNQAVTSGVIPARVEACAGHTVWQSKFKMEPLLRDTDGIWKPADDVAYAPAGGWDGNVSNPDEPLAPDDANWSEENAELASDLWKVWRVTTFADDTLDVEEYETVPDVWHLLPLFVRLVEPEFDDNGDGGQDAYLMGTGRAFHDPDEAVDNTEQGTRFPVKFSLDGQRGVVTTMVPMVKSDDDDHFAAADLFLVCSHLVRSVDTFQYLRHVRFQTFGGTGVLTARRQDVRRTIKSVYQTGTNHTVTDSVEDNESDVNDILDESITGEIADNGPHQGILREYNGTQPIPLSGRVRSVAWIADCYRRPQRTGGDRNFVTIGSQDVESGPIVYDRMRKRFLQSQADQAARIGRQMSSSSLERKGLT
jgi:hypothetical protein